MIVQGQDVPSVKRFRQARKVRRPAAVQQTGRLMAGSGSNADTVGEFVPSVRNRVFPFPGSLILPKFRPNGRRQEFTDSIQCYSDPNGIHLGTKALQTKGL